MKWNTETILDELGIKSIKGVYDVKVFGPGGDVDTEQIIVTFDRKGDERLFMYGFNLSEDGVTNETPGDMEVSHVVITDGQDSRGGLSSANEELCVTYGILCSRMRKLGFNVVPNMDDWF